MTITVDFKFHVCMPYTGKTNHKLHVIKLKNSKNRLPKLDAPINSGFMHTCLMASTCTVVTPCEEGFSTWMRFRSSWKSWGCWQSKAAMAGVKLWIANWRVHASYFDKPIIFHKGKNLNCTRNLSHTAKNLQKYNSAYRDTVQEEYN